MSVAKQDEASSGSGYERVFAYLRQEMIDGSLKGGDLLRPERQLCELLGVSRPVLREALRALSVVGVIEIRHGVGSRITVPDMSILGDIFSFALAHKRCAVDDIMEARIAIECHAVRLGVNHAGPSDLEALRSCCDKIEQTIDDPITGAQADYEFHMALVAASRSETLTSLYVAVADLIYRSHVERRVLVAADANTKREVIDDHYTLLRTLSEGDPDRAEAAVRQHFEIGRAIRTRISIQRAQREDHEGSPCA